MVSGNERERCQQRTKYFEKKNNYKEIYRPTNNVVLQPQGFLCIWGKQKYYNKNNEWFHKCLTQTFLSSLSVRFFVISFRDFPATYNVQTHKVSSVHNKQLENHRKKNYRYQTLSI